MNINRIQSQLQRVPDQALIGYVQNPDGQVPSFLALAELTRRKEIRNASQAQQAPTQTVAQQAVAEAAPGITQLPLPNTMFNEESYANGGIVSFADGGDVQRFDGRTGSSVSSLSANERYALEAKRAELERDKFFSRFDDAITGVTGTPSSWQYRLTGGALGKPYEPSALSADKAYAKQLELQTDTLNRDKYAGTMVDAGPLAGLVPQQNNLVPAMNVPPAVDSLPAFGQVPVEQMNLSQQQQRRRTDTGTQRPGGAATTGSATPAAESSGFTNIPYNDAMYDTAMRPELSAADEAARFNAAMGADPTRAKLNERIAAMDIENQKFKDQNPYLALAEAGFGMAAGQSQFALQNIAEGGRKGIQALVQGRDRIRTAEEKQFELQAKVAEADRAEKRAAVQFGFNSEENIKARNDGLKLKKAEARAETDVTNKKLSLQDDQFKKQLSVEIKKIETQERNATKRVEQQIASQERIATTAAEKEKTLALKTLVTASSKDLDTATKALNKLITTNASEEEIALSREELADIRKAHKLNLLEAQNRLGVLNTDAYLGVE